MATSLKNKQTLYSVVRTEEVNGYDTRPNVHVIAIFESVEEADNYKDACYQEMTDRFGKFHYFDFETQAATYYAIGH